MSAVSLQSKTLSQASKGLAGSINIPGDKSISHRSVIFGSIAHGVTEVSNFLTGEDCLCTIGAFEAMGVEIKFVHNDGQEIPKSEINNYASADYRLVINGQGLEALKAPRQEIYLGNSGTSIRLLSGLFAALPFDSTLTGDESLSKRPMGRVIKPLSEMGAVIESNDGKAPLMIKANTTGLKAINYKSPVASAQVKSCLLLAGLNAEGTTTVTEDHLSRNHSEKMFAGFGYPLSTKLEDNGEYSVSIEGRQAQLQGQKFRVASDISSATFFLVAAAITPGSDLTLKAIGMNPSRTGIIDVLKMMGANLEINNEGEEAGEEVADLRIRHSQLKACTISGALIPRLIDEIPAIAVLASMAEGTTIIKDAEELKVKESDRIASTVKMLQSFGADIEATDDGMIIKGRAGEAFKPVNNPSVDSGGDHRIAMSASIAALVCEAPTTVTGTEFVDTSFPGFYNLLTETMKPNN